MARRSKPKATAPVTADDVARVLGVSQSTISRAFSATASISQPMKLRVIDAANALGYRPNVIARSLITRRTHMVALVMANLTDPFYTVVLDQLAQEIQARGFQTLLFVAAPEQSVDDILPSLLQYQVDAVVLASATISSGMARICAARATPLVLFNRYVPGIEINAVSCDNLAGGRQVADFLIGTGHRRPAFVSGQRDATTNRDRAQGFMLRLKELGVRTCLEEEGGEFSYEAGFAAAQRLLRRAPRLDAIFFASDVMAFGGMDALRAAGRAIPDEVSVVGYDDVPAAAWPSFRLTTIRQPVREMALAAADILDLGLTRAAKAAPTTRFIPGTLIERASTAQRGAARVASAGARARSHRP